MTLGGKKLLIALSSSFYEKKKKNPAYYNAQQMFTEKINLLSQTITFRPCKGPNTTDILTEIFMWKVLCDVSLEEKNMSIILQFWDIGLQYYPVKM